MATTARQSLFPPLVESPRLRLLTVFLFYICQGVPLGLFYLAIPAYMAGAGASPTMIASVVGAAALPWTLKLVNGFIMDRYTFLPMGRRRAWLLGAQSLIILGMLTGAVLAPSGKDAYLLSALAFVITMATTFQDVAIDSLVIDIMPEDEQAKAGGIMFGGQAMGTAGSAAINGLLIESFGISAAYIFSALVLGLGLAYGIAVRERPGEKRLPWSKGIAHPRNLDIQIDAWLPLLKTSFKAMLLPASLIVVPFLLIRALPGGATEVFYPYLTTNVTGWGTSDYTNVSASSSLGAAIYSLTIGGFMVAKLGSLRTLKIVLPLFALLLLTVANAEPLWSDTRFIIAVIWIQDFLQITVAVAMIPFAMRVCSPAVAATQFTIYMAIANFGRPIGAWLAGSTTGGDDPAQMFWILAAVLGAGAVGIWLVRPPRLSAEVEKETAHGAGTAPMDN